MGKRKGLTGRINDLSDRRFNRLLVIKDSGIRTKGGKVLWECLCDCGIHKNIVGSSLICGDILSCGCLLIESRYKNPRLKDMAIKHGMTGTRPYRIWKNMKNRCQNIKSTGYNFYGGRGIKVCKRWESFRNFWEDMKDGYTDNLSIDRIDNNGNYEPDNCRWATPKEQSNNMRNNVL